MKWEGKAMIKYDYERVGSVIDGMRQCYMCKAYTETERTIWGMRTCISADCSPRLSRNPCRDCGNTEHVSIDGLCFYCFNSVPTFRIRPVFMTEGDPRTSA